MAISIKEGMYRDISSVDLESESMLVRVIPLSGGKIQSIFDKTAQYEILYQTERETFPRPYYGMPFEESDLSGFDDMFPTILPCCYPDRPWQGVCLPDHGEVWSIPWAYSAQGDALTLSCHGVKLPYELEKAIAFSKPNAVSISYRAKNRSPFPMKFIWAAHPLVNIDESCEVLLPAETERIFHTYDGADKNAFGRIGNWAEERKRYGTIEDPAEERCGKFYVLGMLQKGACAIYSGKTRRYVKFSFPAEQVPYLGVWLNWNGYAIRQKNMALEPCTAAPDAIDIASRYGWISEIAPNGTYEWNLEIETGFALNREAVGV
jgi:galactose mutarotase-like enzyme